MSTTEGLSHDDGAVPASAARMYDYYLGGSHYLPVDEELAERVVQLLPQTPMIMRANRAFLRRAVRMCAASGIRQFLDLGAGIPTQGPVHEVARAVRPDARVVYVDNDDAAVRQSRELLQGVPFSAAIHGDLRDADAVLSDADVVSLIDFDEPVALLFLSVLQFIPDSDDPFGVVEAYRDALAPGSHLVISHATDEGIGGHAGRITDIYAQSENPIRYRRSADVLRFFGDFHLCEPGLVHIPRWRPEGTGEEREHVGQVLGAAGVGIKLGATV
ncbi:SAM-dependent methyltransferase [Streptomyces sp. NPDC006355]|uniref:SAM-dependent methyltransferase n=1 Tax=Streptomyces sp. NPDC006355 TaxID=3156758 RepID=UPI0033B863E7